MTFRYSLLTARDDVKTMTLQQDYNKVYWNLQRVTFEMTPLDLIRPPLVDEQSIPHARVVVAKLNLRITIVYFQLSPLEKVKGCLYFGYRYW